MPSATSSATSSAAAAAAARGPQVYRGADLRYNLEITLEQAAHGFDTTIRVPSWDKCDTCHGSGAKPGTSPVTCSTCAGHGQVRMQQGFFIDPADLPEVPRQRQGHPGPLRALRRRRAASSATRRWK